MITFGEIAATVALAFGFEPQQITGGDRSHDLVQARHVAIYLARKHTGRNCTVIGQAFGLADHTGVSYATERVEAEMKEDERFATIVRTLEQAILFKIDMSERGAIEVLPLARRIYVNPRRGATSANLHEITALAACVLDLWEAATTSETLIAALRRREAIRRLGIISQSEEEVREADDLDRLIGALSGAITNEMAALRGETEEENDGSRNS